MSLTRTDLSFIKEYAQTYLNAGLYSVLSFMGLDEIEVEAQGITVRDSRGREFIDCVGGYGVFSLGHRHPKVVEAVKRALDTMPLSTKIMLNEPMALLAKRISELAFKETYPQITQISQKVREEPQTKGKSTAADPKLDPSYPSAEPEHYKSFFTNSGTEAVEAALKLAIFSTGKREIISTENSFHGKTLGSLSATGRKLHREPFEPLLSGFKFIPYNDPSALRSAITDQTAAFIVEPVQGEGGIIIPAPDYLNEVRKICDSAGILLVLDEIQTGLGRTGRDLGFHHNRILPDIFTLAKALGGGVMPIGACTAKASVFSCLEERPLLHTSTFGGAEMACAAGLATLDVLEGEKLSERAAEMGAYLIDGLTNLAQQHREIVAEVRGTGLMIGMEFKTEDQAQLAIAFLINLGVLIGYTLNNPKVLRFEPPLIIDATAIDEVIARLGNALDQLGSLSPGVS